MRKITIKEKFSTLKEVAKLGVFLRKTPHWSPEKMKAWQLARIQRLVSHAYQNIPFYRYLYSEAGFEPGDLKTWSDFEKLPLVSKDQVIENFPAKMLQRPQDLPKLIVSRSSGSSGKVLDIAYETKTLTAYALATLRVYLMGFKYLPWDRHVYIYTTSYPFDSFFGLYKLRFIPTLTPIHETLRILTQVRPHLLVCYPSHLRQITDQASPEELKLIRPKLISLNSEISTQAERDYLSEVYGCPALDNYASEEMGRIAAQCLERNYHLFDDLNYVETLDAMDRPTTDTGFIVSTNLVNWACPLIRYRQNDIGKIVDSGCDCGWRFRKLTELQGRSNDCFTLPSGKTLSSGFLLDATYEFLLEDRSAVRDYCLVQEARNSVFLEIVPGKGWNDSHSEKIRRRFHGFFEDEVDFRISLVQECIKTKTGKRNPIINQMNRASGP